MSIKSELKDVDKVSENIKFPIIMIGDITGVVVLFTEWERGVVIYDGDHTVNTGNISNKWFMGDFKRYNGEVVLRND